MSDIIHRRVGSFNILDADDKACLSGNRDAVGEPAGAAAHRFDEKVGPVCLGVGDQIADLPSQEIDRREITKSEINAAIIVIDRLRQVNDRDAVCLGGQLFLIELEFVGRLERIIAANGDKGIDPDRTQRFVDGL
jgi:hypothetical protein